MESSRINYLMYRAIEVDGYGRYGLQQMKALTRLGVNVYPEMVATLEMPGWAQRLRGLDFSKLTISLMPPHEMRGLPGRQWNSTMYEGTGLPADWAQHVNEKAERLIVPSEWLVDVFRDHGVKKGIPIDVVPGGVDTEEFPILPPTPTDRPYTFLAFGDRGTRKGFDTVWRAFYKAFGDKKDVRLVVKSRPCNLAEFSSAKGDPRVSLWREDVRSLSEVFAHVDCFVFPTKGEGRGLPPREAACMGLPVIATNWSGTTDGLKNWGIPIENYQLVSSRLRGDGEWAMPDLDEVIAHMRWCYENRESAREKGLKAAQWLRENQTWEHSARALIQLIEDWG